MFLETVHCKPLCEAIVVLGFALIVFQRMQNLFQCVVEEFLEEIEKSSELAYQSEIAEWKKVNQDLQYKLYDLQAYKRSLGKILQNKDPNIVYPGDSPEWVGI